LFCAKYKAKVPLVKRRAPSLPHASQKHLPVYPVASEISVILILLADFSPLIIILFVLDRLARKKIAQGKINMKSCVATISCSADRLFYFFGGLLNSLHAVRYPLNAIF